MTRFIESIRERVIGEIVRPPISDLKPEEVFFPWEKRWFKKNRVNGNNNYDLHNAVKKGAVAIGVSLEVTRSLHHKRGDHTFGLVYAGPADPFIDSETGQINHLFIDPKLSNGSSIIVITDIIKWKKVESLYLSVNQAINVRKAMARLEAQRSRRTNK